MKRLEVSKYLGDYISSGGLSESVAVTVSKRKGLIIRSIYEIKSVIEDCRSSLVGGVAAGLDLWEMAVMPMALYNAETWQDIDNKTMATLEKLQYDFLRHLLSVGSGCPIPLLLSETGTLMMEMKILQKKVLFLHHLENLPETALAKEVYNAQKRMSLSGILTDCSSFLAKFGLHDLKSFTYPQFKRLVKEKIRILNKSRLIEMINEKGYKKINVQEILNDNFERKPYMSNLSSDDAKMRFKNLKPDGSESENELSVRQKVYV